MKKLIAVLLALVLCASMASVVMAAENDFVESITYKPAPGVVIPEGHEDECIIITPVSDDDASDELKKLYEDILKDKEDFKDVAGLADLIKKLLGDGKTPDDLVVRDLFEVIVPCEDLEKELPEELTFVPANKTNDPVIVLTNKDGKWTLAESKKNDDGTITVLLEEEGPVAFLVPGTKSGGSADTGDSTNQQMVLWIAVAALSLTTIAVLLAVYRRRETEV